MTKPITLYYATNTVNDKLYVGITCQKMVRRIHGHKRDAIKRNKNYAFANAIRKHGMDKFSFHVIETFSAREDANKAEIDLIAKWNTRTPNGYNITAGGDGVNGMPPWNKGKPCPPEMRRHLSEKLKGNVPWSKGKTFVNPITHADRIVKKYLRESERRRHEMVRRHKETQHRLLMADPDHIAAMKEKRRIATLAANVGHSRYKTPEFRKAVLDGMDKAKANKAANVKMPVTVEDIKERVNEARRRYWFYAGSKKRADIAQEEYQHWLDVLTNVTVNNVDPLIAVLSRGEQ